MILKWGSYAHPDNEARVVISAQSNYNEIGTRFGYTERWDISGYVQGSTPAAVTTAYTALRAAYSTDYLDLVLYDSDGSTIRHALYNSGSRRGTQVKTYGYPVGEGAEGSTFRNYSLSVEAEYETDLGVYSRQESYDFTGGGPVFVLVPTLYGPPVRQDVRQQSAYRCVQSGTSIGVGAWPTPSSPIYPDIEHQEQRQIKYDTPREFGRNGNRMYPVSWSYVFESASPLAGRPPG